MKYNGHLSTTRSNRFTLLKYLSIVIIAGALALSGGCYSYSPWCRPQQVEQYSNRIGLIVQEGTLSSETEGSWQNTLGVKYHLFMFPVGNAVSPAISPVAHYDASAGMGRVDQRERQRVDFYFGAVPDRLVRLVSSDHGKSLDGDLAVLGIDPAD